MGFVIRSSDTTAIDGIRQLVSLRLTSSILSDSLIDSAAFLRAGEFATYKLLNLANNDAYASEIGLDNANRAYAFQFATMFVYKGQWMNNIDYVLNDVIYNGTNLYYANKNITAPGSGTFSAGSDWTEITNINFRGPYNDGHTIQNPVSLNYAQYDIVDESSNLYYAKSAIMNAPNPFVTNQWTQIVSGTRILEQTDSEKEFEERTKIAVQYETAIRLILSMPQLLEEQILRERIRYQEINWEKRIEFYLGEITDVLEPVVPDGTIFASGTAIFGEVKQFVAF